MDFRHLTGFESQLDALTRNRQQRAETDYQHGIEALRRAKQSAYHDKAALKEASHKLMAAVQKHRSNPQPYIALAYLLLLLDDKARCQRYLRTALRLDPGNQTALDLQTCLLEVDRVQLTAEDSIARAISQPQAKPQDLDALYESTEKQLRALLVDIMRNPHDTAPTLVAAKLAAMQTKSEELGQLKEKFESSFRILEKELDTTRLASLLRPLEALIRRYQQGIALSATFSRIATECAAQQQQARHLMVAVHVRREQVTQEYEALLDICDALADRLDALDEKQIDITELKAPYKELITQVTLLQELRDELL